MKISSAARKAYLCNEDKLYNLSITLILLYMEDHNQTQCRTLKFPLFALKDTILTIHFQVSLDDQGVGRELSLLLLLPLLGCFLLAVLMLPMSMPKVF